MTQAQALEILKSGQHVFLTGPPGAGKTYVLNQFINYLKSKGKRAGVTASTGIAATHLGGISVHAWSGLGIKQALAKPDMERLLKNRRLRGRFEQSQVLIIDEISMLHAWQLDLVNQIAQAFRQALTPFGGLQLVMCGDLFQLPPVSRDATAQYVTDSNIWPQMDLQVCYLNEQHRHEDDNLLNILNEIRSGVVSDEAREMLASRLHQKLQSPKQPTKLHTLNVNVDQVNSFELTRISRPGKRYVMRTRGSKPLVSALQNGCLAPAELTLKAGAQVMFVKNNFEAGYVNGTIGAVVDFDDDGFPVVETLKGEEIVAAPESWSVEENGKVQAEIVQVPLRLAWAITVHKSQGMSLDAAEMDLARAFVPGIGYVALSRVRSLASMTLLGIEERALQVDPKVLEIDHALREQSKQALSLLAAKQLVSVERSSSGRLAGEKPKTSNREKTQQLIEQKLSIPEIARQLGFTERTIIKHIDELVTGKQNLDIEYLLPVKSDLDKVVQAFDACGLALLKPVYEYLREQYDYDQLSLVRAWVYQHKRENNSVSPE